MRSNPLIPESQKEVAFIEYVDSRILNISRKYAKKFSNDSTEEKDAAGYDDFIQVVEDLEAVFNVVWISGTRRWIPSSPISSLSSFLWFMFP